MNSSNPNKWTIADVLANFGKKQAEVQQEKMLKDQLKQALMQNQAQSLGQFIPGMQQQMQPQEQEMSLDQAYQQAKAGGIHLDPAKKGTFKAQATRMKMSIQEAAAHILANKENYSPAMVKKANFARNFAKEEGGTINNPGFNALPDYVQHKILSHMAYGGESNMDEYKNGGYTVRRTNERKGKTHVVTGPDGTKKYFGDPNMGERSKSKYGKEAFYARHAQNLKNNPYFRAYAKATWADGGTVPSSPEEWGAYIKSIESQIGNPSSWTLEDYNTLQDALNQYKNWRETTPEGQAVVDYHNEPGEYEIPVPEHLQGYVTGMMKSKLAYANEFGNPAAQRMIVAPDNPYDFGNGMIGTHYMASMDNYAIPQIQNVNGQLQLGNFNANSNEAMQFNNPAEAQYFAEHYKQVSPAFNQEYEKGGEMIKRADGSYSQRGLWDNIRANAGSGRKPTREMLEQERKLRRKAMGGMMGPNDCPEGHEWNDEHQTCLPQGTTVPDSTETETFMKNWYQERPKIYSDPNYINAITDPEFPNDAKKHIQLMNQIVPQMQGQFVDGTLPPIQFKDSLADPNAVGQYVPQSENPEGAQIYVRKDELENPLKFKSTLAHEWTTHLNDPFFYDNDRYSTFYNNVIGENVIPWEDFLNRAVQEGKVDAKDKAGIKMIKQDYDYSTTPTQDNIHSNINVARQLFNLQPTEVITEDKVKQMMQEAEQKGYVDRNSPNYIDDIYRLYRLSKDNKSLANLFNLLADSGNKNNVPGSDIQMAKYGGNIGKLRKFF